MSNKTINKKNKSKTYLLPLLISRLDLDMSYIDNTYLYTINNFEDYLLHIVHKFNNFEEKERYDKSFTSNLIDIQKLNDKEEYLYSFELDNDFKDSYKKFVKGKYSKITNVDKNLILTFWQNQNERQFSALIKDIFDKSPILRKSLETDLAVKLSDDAELSSIIDLEKEIFYGD